MALSFGQYLIKDHLPPGVKPGRTPLSKKILKEAFVGYAKEHPEDYVRRMQGLKKVADEIVTLNPLSPGLDDITPDYKARDRIFARARTRLDAARTYPQQMAALAMAQSGAIDLAKKHPGSMAQEVMAGARGSPVQLVRTLVSPVVALKPDKTVYPYLIGKSYAEGLTPGESWIANSEARVNAAASNLSVSEPGDLQKIFVNNMSNQVVATEDCGIRNGIALSVDSPEIRDRYVQASRGLARNTLVTTDVAKRLSKKGGVVIVRSPSTCELPDGICQKCAGLNEVGTQHSIGTNLGVRAGHVLSEPLTQMALDSKHGGKLAARKGREAQTIKRLRSLIEVPESFANRAIVAEEDGRVEDVTPAPQGGHYITAAGHRYYTPPEAPPIVRKGIRVEAGDALADGVPNPKDITRLKGIGAGRDYLIEKLNNLYSSSGHNIDRRHLEILAKSHLNYADVIHPGAVRGLRAGDLVAHAALRGKLRENATERSLASIEGHVLGDDYLHHTAGTRVTPTLVESLKEAGIDRVRTLKPEDAPQLQFVMKPLSRNPLLNPDVLSRLGHRYLKTALLEGVHAGRTSKLKGYHPTPPMIHGARFGMPPVGGMY